MSPQRSLRALAGRARWRIYESRCEVTRSALADTTRGDLHYALNISTDRGYVLVNNPKTGLSSLKDVLIGIEATTAATTPRSPHDLRTDPFVRLTELRTTAPLSHLIGQGFTFVTMVRDPYARLVSSYRGTISRHQAVDAPRRARWLASLGLPTSRTSPVEFDEFVSIVVGQTDGEMDPHWRTQTTQVLHRHLPFAFIGRFENFDDDVRRLLATIGVPPETAPPIGHRNASGASANLREWYSDELEELVRHRYRSDFEAFGYSTSLPSPPP